MNAVATDVNTYIAAVERYFDDLPDDDRRDLLDDVREHVTEVGAEDEGTLEERLGPPERYAAELRASAGLPPYVARAEMSAAERLRRSLRASPLGAIADLAPVRAVRGFLPELRPAWWVLRGYLVAIVVDAILFTRNASDGGLPWPSIDGSTTAGTLLVAVCVVLSVIAGRVTSRDGRLRTIAVVANAAIVLISIGAFPRNDFPTASVRMVDAGPVGILQHGDGSPIMQICAYDQDGNRLKNVQLFDQDGRPVEGRGGKLGLLMDKIKGEFGIRPGDAKALDGMGRVESFECPKKLKDLRSKVGIIERGDSPMPRIIERGVPLPPKLRGLVDDVR